jgi:uncharacterized protein YbjT (DUF2867 family)
VTILITGARGAIARALHDQLAANGIPHRLASRSASAAGIDVAVDFNRPESLPAALDGIDKIFVYAADGIEHLVEAAERAEVARIVLVSSLSTALPDAADNPITAHHLAAERCLTASTIPATFLRPGAFATNSRMWATSIRADGIAEVPYPEARLDSIHEADIADVAFAALTEDGHEGKAYELTGPEFLSQREQVALIGATLGRQIAVRDLDREAAEKFLPTSVLDMFAAAEQGELADWPSSQDVTGRPSRSFATWAADHIRDFS